MPRRSIASRNSLRSSAISMASRLAPIISTLNLSSTPISSSCQRGVQPGLAAHGRQQRVGAFLFDDLGYGFRGDGLDIGGVGKAGVGHDRGRVRVDQNDPVTFFPQRFAGLSAGIIEFAGLSNNNGARADNHDRLDVGTLWHR